MPEAQEFFTVSQINGMIRDVINMGFPQPIWVCGEIQGYDRNRGKKHVFFELCEKDPQSKDIVARIGLVIFAGRKEMIEGILKSAANAFHLKDDIEVKFLCRIDFYPPHGAMRLIVETIDPVYTLGKIAQEKQRLIALLKKKGVLDKNKRLPLPTVPLTIGLISAHDSAAYNDFLSELRFSGYGFRILFRKALMQGKGAEADVCGALNELARIRGLDVIVVTRGGGSIAELSCFDSQKIAEGIAASPVPVLSGIGHEVNITVTDLAAHTYQKTPTAIAGFLVGLIERFVTDLEEKGTRVINLADDRISREKRHLRDVALGLQKHADAFFKAHHRHMGRLLEFIRRVPLGSLKQSSQDISRQEQSLGKAVRAQIRNVSTRIRHYERIVEIASPLNTLRRGFTITRLSNGRLLRRGKDVRAGDQLTTELVDGSVDSRIQKVRKKEESDGGKA